MARDFARTFYRSPAWQKCRDGYFKKAGGLCERCLTKGIVRPGEIVHHKIHLTPQNIDNPDITLNWDNLELVCRDCHAEEHPEIYGKEHDRYAVDDDGNVTFIKKFDK